MIAGSRRRYGEEQDGGMSWTFVSVPAGFYAALEQDIAQGLRSVRAEVLIGDLEDLFAWWARQQ